IPASTGPEWAVFYRLPAAALGFSGCRATRETGRDHLSVAREWSERERPLIRVDGDAELAEECVAENTVDRRPGIVHDGHGVPRLDVADAQRRNPDRRARGEPRNGLQLEIPGALHGRQPQTLRQRRRDQGDARARIEQEPRGADAVQRDGYDP